MAQLTTNPVSEPGVQEQSSSADQVPASNGNSDTTSSPSTSGDSDDGVLSMLFSGYGLTAFFVLLLAALFVIKKIRAKRELDEESFEPEPQQPRRNQSTQMVRSHTGQVEDRTGIQNQQGTQTWESPAATHSDSDAVFGAYRADQEVWKLVLGKPHRMDVMASRAPEDRRAIEASLVKALTAPDTNEEGRRHSRQALEEYGFVARQSAQLLLGRDAWERSSAARSLGQIRSTSSLPFLIEALHDADHVVRNQVVASLGSLRLPAAIGALLDIARRHPEIPATLLSEALSECSVDTPGFLDLPVSENGLLPEGVLADEASDLEALASFEDLPDGAGDASLAEALTQLKHEDSGERIKAVQLLGLHSLRPAVAALGATALDDPDSAVRAAAVAGLSSIDHESVFAPVLIALADESRVVRAAAARALNGLHFDRADAYVRVMETADPQTLQRVARACVTTGISAQAVDRLASEDRHQAYEAFSLFSLLARANENGPILEAIEKHPDVEARLCALRVLNVAGSPEVAPALREMVASETLSENLRTAMLEVLYRLDQEQPVCD
jgi:HEAT repeat protein